MCVGQSYVVLRKYLYFQCNRTQFLIKTIHFCYFRWHIMRVQSSPGWNFDETQSSQTLKDTPYNRLYGEAPPERCTFLRRGYMEGQRFLQLKYRKGQAKLSFRYLQGQCFSKHFEQTQQTAGSSKYFKGLRNPGVAVCLLQLYERDTIFYPRYIKGL